MLKIIVNSDKHLAMGEPAIDKVEHSIQRQLGRFEGRLTRVVVHLRDENGPKSGKDDVRCMIEARPEGMDSINVSEDADSVELAVNRAARKLERALESSFGRLAQ